VSLALPSRNSAPFARNLFLVLSLIFAASSWAFRDCQKFLGPRALSDGRFVRQSWIYSQTRELRQALESRDTARVDQLLAKISRYLGRHGFKTRYQRASRSIEFLPDRRTMIGRWVIAMRQAARNRNLRFRKYRLLFAPEECQLMQQGACFSPQDRQVTIGLEAFEDLLRHRQGAGHLDLFHEIGGHFRIFLNRRSGRDSRPIGWAIFPVGYVEMRWNRIPKNYRCLMSFDEPLVREAVARKHVEYGDLGGAMAEAQIALEMNEALQVALQSRLDARKAIDRMSVQLEAAEGSGDPKARLRSVLAVELRLVRQDHRRLKKLIAELTEWDLQNVRLWNELEKKVLPALRELSPIFKRTLPRYNWRDQREIVYFVLLTSADFLPEEIARSPGMVQLMTWWRSKSSALSEEERRFLRKTLLDF
jgi:hypothetical protein